MRTVRDARAEDAGRLLEIYAFYVENTAISFEYEAPSLADFTARIENTLKRGYPWLVLEEDGRIEGYAYAGPFKTRAAYDWSAEVSVYVDQSAHRRGLGRELYAALEDKLRERGIRNLYACIAWPTGPDEYLTTNSADFHGHIGYTRVGEFHQCAYKFQRWYDMIWMEKFIGEHGKL